MAVLTSSDAVAICSRGLLEGLHRGLVLLLEGPDALRHRALVARSRFLDRLLDVPSSRGGEQEDGGDQILEVRRVLGDVRGVIRDRRCLVDEGLLGGVGDQSRVGHLEGDAREAERALNSGDKLGAFLLG